VICTHENDRLKTLGIIGWIHGLAHDGTPLKGVPAVFGSDYQAVSVGQKVPMTHRIPPASTPLPQPTPHACRVIRVGTSTARVPPPTC